MSSKVPWDRVGGGFCENLIAGFPEQANSWSSVFIAFIGFVGLFISSLNEIPSRKIYSGMICAGIGSFMFHWAGYAFYGYLDVIPMFLVSWFLNELVWTAVIEAFTVYGHKGQDLLLDLTTLITNGCLIFTLANDRVSGSPWGIDVGFTASFAAPQFTTAIGVVILLWRFWGDLPRIVKKHSFIGIAILSISALIWVSTEPNCKENGVLRNNALAYTHMIWHIGFSWGAHFVIQAIIFLELSISEMNPNYREGRFYQFFPIVDAVEEITDRKLVQMRSVRHV
jgi:hypothetical protein